MSNINFLEIATYCVDRFKNSLVNQNRQYVKTLFFAINEKNEILCSSSPHVLQYASQCILIHVESRKGQTIWHSFFQLEYIDVNGCVRDSNLDDGFTLNISWSGNWDKQRLYLDYNGTTMYSNQGPWEVQIPIAWNLYQNLMQAKTETERRLILYLFEKDQSILQLKKEVADFQFYNHLLQQQRDQYKGLLDEIKQLITPRQ